LLPIAAGITYPVVLDRGIAVPADETIALMVVAGAVGLVWAMVRSVLDGRTT